MKKFSLAILTIASLAGTAGTALAQTYYDDGDGYYVDPSPYYGPRYRERYYDDDRYERRVYRERSPYRQWDGCPRHYSVQDGVCKPYRGY